MNARARDLEVKNITEEAAETKINKETEGQRAENIPEANTDLPAETIKTGDTRRTIWKKVVVTILITIIEVM